MKNVQKANKLVDSFNAAIEGFLYVFKTQRNMRIHFLLALLVIMLGIYLNFSRVELMLLCLTIGLVLITEMINTAIEIILNKISSSYTHWVKLVKDISAGAVLVASLNAIIIGYLLFFKQNVIYDAFRLGMDKISQSDWHISFITLAVIVGIVIAGKTFFHRGEPLRGGMPSGHSAIAFSIWILVALITQSSLLVFTVFVLAFMVAQSRIARHYHTFWEVFAGAVVGIVTTVLVYRLLTG
ncbi:MAG: diacylglycerol kinase [Candidatus Omnitrophica bacterium]|nr:diacylglycerol kinase [Candidatus Omnitrophota bacterium]